MTLKLHIASALALAGMVWSSAPSVAEEVGDGHLQTAAYDVIIVPREGRAARSRIWTEQGWTTLPTQRGATAYVPRPRTARTWEYPRTDYPRAGDRPRSWTYASPNGRYPRTDRAQGYDGRRGAQQDMLRPTWRPRYAERLY